MMNEDLGNVYERQLLAEDIDAVPEILARLAQDDDPEVRMCVARNKRTPVEILRRLAEDAKWLVREGVVYNINTPAEILHELTKDPDEAVQGAARITLKVSGAHSEPDCER